MRLQDLAPNPRNPRKITDKKLEMLRKSLAEFGDLSGIVFNRRTGNLVGGHQRLKVLPLDAEIHMDTETHGHVIIGGDRFTYREVDWDDTKEKAANIAANKHGGDWDLPQLSEWLLELDTANIDMELTGFEDEELKGLMAPVQTLEPQCDEDEVPEHVEPKTKRGDIYQLGRHRLMCGDSTSIDDVEKLMDGEKADMVYSDPPYGMNLDTDFSRMKGSQKALDNPVGTLNAKSAKRHASVIGDDADFDPGIFFGVFDYVKEIFLWGADYYCQSLPRGGSWVVWDKTGGHDSLMNAGFASNFELCWSKQKHKRDLARITWKGAMGRGGEIGGGTVHPTQKPIKLAEWFFERWGDKNDKVADLFGGSGSTLIACEKTNRSCFMMELDPKYCSVIIERWRKYTGKEAYLINEDGTQTPWSEVSHA